jgi:tetratricopeptide (TPR) repeat protein
MLKKNSAEARAAFDRALAIDANQADALAGLATLDLQAGNPTAARERIERRLAANPKNTALMMFAARTYVAVKDYPAAERVLRQVVDLDPSLLSAYALLGQVYAAEQRLDEAREEFEVLAQKRPNAVAAPTLVGMIYQSQNKTDQAKTWYEKAIAIDPKAPVAANNLAWLSAETGGNLDVALQLAQTAKAGLPDMPEVDDTLGWIYYKKGLATLAIRSFTTSVEKDPKNATYHYHLGLAYMTNRENDKARKSLQDALALKPNADESAGAQKALASLKG